MRPPLALAAVVASLAAFAPQAQAHTHLVSADPAANAVVASPKAITLRFNETLAASFSSFELTRSDGAKAAITVALDTKDRKALRASLRAPLEPGVYKVSWRAVGKDAHRMTGAYSFTVR